jgi:protein-disulfide isomerase
MKIMKYFFVSIIAVLLVMPTFNAPSYGGVDEDVKELQKEMSKIKKDIQEMKMLMGLLSQASIDDDPMLGDQNAPLTLIEFSDYQCPYCSRFSREIFPQIKEAYIKTGKVRYVFRDFPIEGIHPKAQKAAEAAQCSGEQDKYWEMHDLLFEKQKALEITDLKGYAAEIGLEMTAFETCLDSGKYEKEIMIDLQAGQMAGVRGTPSFVLGKTTKDGVIEGRFIRGAQPYPEFKKAFEAMLSEEE